jgi:Flp pilus assembly protein TadD
MKSLSFLGNHKTLKITVAILILVCAGAWFASPYIRAHRDRKVTALLAEADQVARTDIRKAAANYHVAAFLKPSDHSILQHLADLYVELDRPTDAIGVLRQLRIGESGLRIASLQLQTGDLDASLSTLERVIKDKRRAEAYLLKSRVLLEKGDLATATQAARDASNYDLANSEALPLLAACQALENKPEGLKAYPTSILLARYLYASGLPRSTERYLAAQKDLNNEGWLLLSQARISLKSFGEAKTSLISLLANDPANLEARKLLKSVYEKLGDTEAAKIQHQQIEELEQGRV